MIRTETATELEIEQQSQIQLEVLSHQQLQEPNTDQLQQQGQTTEKEKTVPFNQRRLFPLLFVGFCICALTIGLIYYAHQQFLNDSTGNEQKVNGPPCASAACLQASEHLSMSADPFTKPCDYFLFTCDSDWKRGSQERVDRRSRKEKVTDRKTLLLQYLREILDSNERSASSAVQKAKLFYHSCLDTRSIETAGAEPFLTLIQNLGGWAVSGQWNQTDFNSTLGVLMRDYGTFPFFNLYVGKDPNEVVQGTTRKYIQIDQPDLFIPIEWNRQMEKSQVTTETLRPFLALCQRYFTLLGAPSSSSMFHVGMFISLSSELAVSAAPLEHRLSKGQLFQRMTIRELQRQAPLIDWLSCLQTAFAPLTLSIDDYVLLHNLPYIVQMSRIINKWLNKADLSNSGPLHTFMLLNLLHTMMPALDSRFTETVEEVDPRWKTCVLETEKGFDPVFTHLLGKRMAHTEATEVIENIFSTLKSKLHELKWDNQKIHKTVLKKVQSLTPRLWTTPQTTETELDVNFSQITVGTDFFWNYVQLLSLWQKRRSKLLAEQSERVDILSVTPIVRGNELILPVGMFVPPHFHPTYPRALNYGVIGFLIAKDILHLLLPDIHVQSVTVHVVGDCVWAHYLSVTEKNQAGVSSLSTAQQQEVWVQYSALQLALRAYHESVRNHLTDTSLSGLSHTRLFLTAFSQINCDSDQYHMPLEPSFLVKVLCASTNMCNTNLHCPSDTHQRLLKPC